MNQDPPPRRVESIQCLVYYISKVLHDAKTRYLEVHKLLYVVLIASRKLCHYFQAHKISVVTSYPLKAVLHNPNVTGNITKWDVELADFVANWTPPLPCHLGGPDDSEPETRALVLTGPHWTLFFDGSSRNQGVGVGVLLLTLDGEQFKYMVHLDFKATNNMTEYETLNLGLSTVLSLGV
jgi:hypothetical protein